MKGSILLQILFISCCLVLIVHGKVPYSNNLLVPVGASAGSKINCTCGRIYNYTEAGTGKMPWVGVLVHKHDSLQTPLCWGSLINDRYVLSAASCTSKYKTEDVAIVLDHFGVADPRFPYATKVAFVASIKNHPRFSVGNHTYDNDISLIKLRDRIDFTNGDKLAPVCLPPDPRLHAKKSGRSIQTQQSQDNNNAIHNHNGASTDKKSGMEAFLFHSKQCDFPHGSIHEKRMTVGVYKGRISSNNNTKYPDTRYSYSLLVLQGLRQEACLKFYKNRVESQFFCAEGISGEDALKSRDRCNTDPGSPLVTLRRTRYKCDPDFTPVAEKDILTVRFVQTGISTNQKECIEPKHHPYPILLFTSVFRYRKWIMEGTRDAGYCLNSP